MILTENQKEVIEKMGVFQEKSGIPPTEARIAALLLIAPEAELTFDEIRETLQVSKSATSNALNTLLLTNRVQYRTKHGDRKRYFSSNLSKWEANAEQAFNGILSVNIIMKEILSMRPPHTTQFNKDLAEVIEFTNFLHGELMLSFDKWKKRK